MRKSLALFMLLAIPAAAAAQSESFVVRMGRDTIAIETFVLTPSRLEGELRGAALPTRVRYSLQLAGGKPVSLQSELIPPGADTANRKASMQFVRDSVIIQLSNGGAAQPEQRIATQPNALPFVNLAFSFVEIATMRAQRTIGDSTIVPFFDLGSGRTITAKLKWESADTAVMTIGGAELRMHIDARGRILHATVPMQNVTVERVAGTLERASSVAPDYSAPAGAHYTAQDIVARSPAGHTLAGTLTLPKARSGRIPAVITISGSGAQDRDESLAGMRGYRPFRELAESLARRGVAVLRYDDRGFGASTGVYSTATSADFADDTRTLVAWLRARPEIDPARIFLAGHSEGGMIAPMVAADDTALAGIVLLAGPAFTGRRILEYQTRYGVDLQTGKTQAERDSLYRMGMATLDSTMVQQPWLRYFGAYDPLPVVRKVRVPVLIVHGQTDRQVTYDQAEILANTLRAAGNSNVAVHVLPNVNHLFLSDPVGNAVGYSSLRDRNVVPQLLQIVGDWIITQSK